MTDAGYSARDWLLPGFHIPPMKLPVYVFHWNGMVLHRCQNDSFTCFPSTIAPFLTTSTLFGLPLPQWNLLTESVPCLGHVSPNLGVCVSTLLGINPHLRIPLTLEKEFADKRWKTKHAIPAYHLGISINLYTKNWFYSGSLLPSYCSMSQSGGSPASSLSSFDKNCHTLGHTPCWENPIACHCREIPTWDDPFLHQNRPSKCLRLSKHRCPSGRYTTAKSKPFAKTSGARNPSGCWAMSRANLASHSCRPINPWISLGFNVLLGVSYGFLKFFLLWRSRLRILCCLLHF